MNLDADRATLRSLILDDLGVLDTPREPALDDIVFIAAQACRAPIALVSLLDHDRQWFKARTGLDAQETPIEQSVCKHGIDDPGLLIIPDLTQDERTRDNPLVTGEPHIRFYAGAPLLTPQGVAIGRLCVIDKVLRPEGLTEEQQKMLLALARQVMVQLELQRSARLAAELVHLQAVLLVVTERIRQCETVADMTRGVAEIVGTSLGADRAGFGTVDPATEIVEIEPDWTADGIASIAGRYRFDDFGEIRTELARGEPLIINDVEADPRADTTAMRAIDIGGLVNMPVRERGTTVAVFIVHSCAPRTWSDAELSFLRNVADRLEVGVAQLRAEQHQNTVNQEIGHRFKNMLAMVQAIATQTLRRVIDRGPIEQFEQRLMALGAAHDVLTDANWRDATLADVLDAVLAILGYGDRISRRGPPVALGPRASLSFSLLIHELTTNAIKYGALSNEAGHVEIDWQVTPAPGDATLTVHWRERGGPPAVTPTRRGFGSKLIQLGLVGTGGVELRYEPTGLQADMSASINHLAQS